MNVYVISSVRTFIVWNAWIVVARPFMFYDLHLREYQDLSRVLMARGRKKREIRDSSRSETKDGR